MPPIMVEDELPQGLFMGARLIQRALSWEASGSSGKIWSCDVALLCLYSVSPLRKPTKKKHYCRSPLLYIANNYMSDCENPRFTERTSTNLGRSHRLPHVCTIMIYGKLGGYRLQETAAFIYIYIYMCVCDEL